MWKLIGFNKDSIIIQRAGNFFMQQATLPNNPSTWDYVGLSKEDKELLLRNISIKDIDESSLIAEAGIILLRGEEY